MILISATSQAAVVYVDKDATGANNGSSWADAFTTLQPAMNAAVAGDEVWIAAGNYGENRTPLGRLVVPTDITVVGGFAGGETSIEQRNTTVNRSVIDGSTSNGGGRAEQVIQDAANCNFIGVVFKGGNATNGDSGALNLESDMEFLECSFEDNSALNYGGAVFCGTSGLNIAFRKCTFRNNATGIRGGAVFFSPPSSSPPILFEDCVFDGNQQLDRNQPYPNGGGGGAVYLENNDPGIFRRCIFAANTADGFDGAVSIENSSTVFENCLFYRNQAGLWGAVTTLNSGATKWLNCSLINNTAGTGGTLWARDTPAVITNCIVWTGAAPPEITVEFGSAPTVTYSNVEEGYPGTGNISGNPLFVDVPSDNFRLQTLSPCVDSGTSVGTPTSDIVGRSRPRGNSVDMGAYEHYDAWVLENANAQFGPRHGHASNVHLGSMWVMAGWDNGSLVPTAFRSTDGHTWTSVADCGNTSHPASAVFDGKLWLLGGWSGFQAFTTTTGNAWVDEGDLDHWGASAVVLGGELLVVGGNNGSLTNAVQRWVEGTGFVFHAAAPWAPRNYHGCVLHNGRVFVLGGGGGSGMLNDVWSSADGINWSQETASAPWSPRVTACVSADGLIWVLGGGGASNDVWTSVDGRTWNLESLHAEWSARGGHTALAFQDKIWVIGGLGSEGSDLSDVWSLDLNEWTPMFTYTNDDVDRLKEVDTNVGTRIAYEYDPAGNRLGKEVSAVLSIDAGTGMPVSGGVPAGTGNKAIVQLALTATAGLEGAILKGITFATSGSGNEDTGITLAELWDDTDASGTENAGDVLLGSVNPAADNGDLEFSNLLLLVSAGTTRNLVLTYDLAGTASAGETFTAGIADRHAIEATGATSGKSLYVMGAPVSGAALTVSTDATPPVFAGIESAEASDGQVTIGWTMANDAVDPQGSLAYAVWVSESSPAINGQPDYMTPGMPAIDEYGANLDSSKLFFTIQGLTNGQTYYFLVRAQDTKGNRSNNIEELPATPLAPLYTLAVNGVNGSVGVSPQGGIYEAGSMVTLSPVADEGYVFSGWTGDVGPTELETSPLSVLMDQPKSITANFSAGSGTVEVAVSPEDAPWVVTDATSGTHQGVGNTTLTGLPVGSTIIAWGSVPGQLAPQPSTEISYLAANTSLRFVGAYTPINVGDDCQACTPDTKTHYNVGETACLGVAGTFPPGTLFQWSKQGVGVLSEGRMFGVNCQTLTIPDLDENDSGVYVCEYEGQKSLYTIEITVGSPGVPTSTKAVLLILALTLSLFGAGALRYRFERASRS